jgi:hypothetical protein
MTACPIRYQRQVSDRKGKIFYTSITSLSHISKVSGNEAADGRWRSGTDRNDSCSVTCRFILIIWGNGTGEILSQRKGEHSWRA